MNAFMRIISCFLSIMSGVYIYVDDFKTGALLLGFSVFGLLVSFLEFPPKDFEYTRKNKKYGHGADDETRP